jgi:uncharacterized protein YfaS (alpha-2-macroglobulin family)
VDTAFWAPSLKTDENGHARVTFTMPDALTRWRITGRAMDAQGRVGQRTAYLRSDKAFYAKWTAPDWLRAGDAPRASVAVFNQTGARQALDVLLTAGLQRKVEKLDARPGVNYVEFPVTTGASPMRLEVRQGARTVDVLDTPMHTLPVAWSGTHSVALPLSGKTADLKLPADARNVRVSFAYNAASHFARIADDLIDYPYGCVEQTSSRLIPLTMAIQGLGPDAAGVRDRLMATLQAQRLRLVAMAGPHAVFGWWGNGTQGDALMTAYAYYADWMAARTLRIDLPPEHWNNVLAVYQEHGLKAPLLDRALVLWLAHEMGLPTRTLAAGLVEDSANVAPGARLVQAPLTSSLLLGAPAERGSDAMGLALLSLVAAENGVALPAPLEQQVSAAWNWLRATPAPAAQALLLLGGQLPAAQADAVLASVRSDMPTMDRALALVWIQKKLGGPPPARLPAIALEGGWQQAGSPGGLPAWRWADGKAVPARLQLAQAAPPGMVAVVQYESRAIERHALPVAVERRIYRLRQESTGYRTELVKPNETLRTDELYLDEVTLRAAPAARYRFGLLEVALPPGASVEAGTWGISLLGGAQPVPLERARHVERRDGYAVPVEPLAGEVKVRHLLRFAQKGRYVLPPARFYRMYQPEQKAFEAEGKAVRVLQVG